MNYKIHSFRHGEIILKNEPDYKIVWNELLSAIENITDDEIIEHHENNPRKAKSISESINNILKSKLVALGWNEESYIFQDDEYSGNRWRLDFAKDSISVEVAFNHGEAIAWNLIKPVLAGELNHVQKEINTEIGVIICATKELKDKGGFDGAVGEYEKFLTYLNPLRDVLSVPIVIIGLEAPTTFEIKVEKIDNKKQGIIKKY
ncbi:MAG: BglII/BstYI family type II restriction endonuclease [Campylobacterota bacterium]|nr:BglII/BstYI family type II restriction endonuclease [Campylobacterota bacterium]